MCILSNTNIPNYIRAKQLINFHEHVLESVVRYKQQQNTKKTTKIIQGEKKTELLRLASLQ